LQFLNIEGVRIDRFDGLANGVGQHQLGGGHVTVLCLKEESLGEGFKVVFADRLREGLPERGGTTGEGIAGAAGVALDEAAVFIAVLGAVVRLRVAACLL
jgi:hypothetical protein